MCCLCLGGDHDLDDFSITITDCTYPTYAAIPVFEYANLSGARYIHFPLIGSNSGFNCATPVSSVVANISGGNIVAAYDDNWSGETFCEGHGWLQETCEANGCCQWSSLLQECHSAVGDNTCPVLIIDDQGISNLDETVILVELTVTLEVNGSPGTVLPVTATTFQVQISKCVILDWGFGEMYEDSDAVYIIGEGVKSFNMYESDLVQYPACGYTLTFTPSLYPESPSSLTMTPVSSTLNGFEACDNLGYDETQCKAVRCCYWERSSF